MNTHYNKNKTIKGIIIQNIIHIFVNQLCEKIYFPQIANGFILTFKGFILILLL